MSQIDLGLEQGELRVVPYQTSWPQDFQKEVAAIQDLQLKAVQGLHHIGSTAVPGLSAKPIIDILVATELAETDSLIEPLALLNYRPLGFLYSETDFLLFKDTRPVTHCLHLVETGCREFFEKLYFRDLLIASEKDRSAYAYLKLKISRRFPNDRRRYGELKASFIRKRLKTMNNADARILAHEPTNSD